MRDNIINTYNNYLMHFKPNDPSSVGWTDKENQYTRFDALFSIGIQDSDKVLDYGCGLGHLNEYISDKGFSNVDYCGIDINPSYIYLAKVIYPDKTFHEGEMDIVSADDNFDYIIGSGVFSVGVTDEYVYNSIKMAYNHAKKGVAFNFLKKESNLEPLKTYDKDKMLELLSSIGDVIVLDGYLGDEDFTILIKK